jgi:hypothetical protein
MDLMSDIKSKLISGVSASEITNRRFQKQAGIAPGTKIAYMVLKVKLDSKTYYCCLSGGKLDSGEVLLTDVGRAALETLLGLPVGNDEDIVFQEVEIGETPLDIKVKATLRKLRSGSKVCFVGDMAGELDGKLFNVFNVSGSTEV